MTVISLKQMAKNDFEEFKSRAIHSYAIEMIDSLGLPDEQAHIRSKKETDSLLEDGIRTENYVFLSIFKETRKENIGHIWIRLFKERKVAFIFHIEILKNYRGKGLGSKTMDQLEIYLKKSDIKTIRLNVFNKNDIARSLYEKKGFWVASSLMQKELQ